MKVIFNELLSQAAPRLFISRSALELTENNEYEQSCQRQPAEPIQRFHPSQANALAFPFQVMFTGHARGMGKETQQKNRNGISRQEICHEERNPSAQHASANGGQEFRFLDLSQMFGGGHLCNSLVSEFKFDVSIVF